MACRNLRRFAKRFPLGRPHAYVWSGLLASLQDSPRTALRQWDRAIAAAEALRMPYERGRAHLEIGRHLDLESSERRYHLHRAADVFEKLGAASNLARVRAELQRSPPAPSSTTTP